MYMVFIRMWSMCTCSYVYDPYVHVSGMLTYVMCVWMYMVWIRIWSLCTCVRYAYVCVHVRENTYTVRRFKKIMIHTHTHTCMHACVSVCVCVCVSVCVCVCLYVVCAYTHLYTHMYQGEELGDWRETLDSLMIVCAYTHALTHMYCTYTHSIQTHVLCRSTRRLASDSWFPLF